MPRTAINSDTDLLDLIRVAGPVSVPELEHAAQVTATAVRQRLGRLVAQSLVRRELDHQGRGRPKYRYSLTEAGLRQAGSDFTDLALALWRELRNEIHDEASRRDALRRIARAMAVGYQGRIRGATPAERLESLGQLLNERRIPASVETTANHPTLTAHACPYPRLAEEDPNVCLMEKMLFSELVGGDLSLTQCRLHGGTACQFQTG